MDTVLSLIKTMFRIGLMGFGGGNALVPVIKREAVDESELITPEEFDKDIIVANITPGALPVELASGVGRKVLGRRGMIAGAAAMAAPGTILTVLLMALFSVLAEPMSRQVRFASVGISSLIIVLLVSYCLDTAKENKNRRQLVNSLFLIIAVFMLTNGKELNEVLNIEDKPMFAVSTLNVLAVTFFIICYSRGRIRSKKGAAAVVISALYLISIGQGAMITDEILMVRNVLKLVMAVLGGWGLICSIGGEENKLRTFPLRKMLGEIVCWLGFIVLLCIPALILCPNALLYCAKALASVLLSFGGGDAYLVVAKGMFVGSDMISRSEFYGQVVTISNAMPGSILCKVLSATGWCIGEDFGIAASLSMALAGFGCAVGMSGLTFMLIYRVYDQFENLDIFQAIRRHIRPIIGGLLLTVAVSMLSQNLSVGASYGIPDCVMLPFTLVMAGAALYMRRTKKPRLITLIVVLAAAGVVFCNLLQIML